MRHPHHLPPNVPAVARAPSADAMGVLIRAEPLQRSFLELGVCQGDGRCRGCPTVKPAKPTPMQQFRHAIAIAALAGISVGAVFGALRWAAEWVGS